LLIKPREYEGYADLIKRFAFKNFMLPQQMQATLWFVRKRLLNVKYDAQHDLFGSSDDMWKTARDVDEIKPYSKRENPIGIDAKGSIVFAELGLEGGACHEVRENKKARRSSARSAKP
jgi:hypothetical protein